MAIVNFTVENDADFYRQFLYRYLDGSPIDLTGNTMKMGIRKRAADAIEEMLLTTENGGLAIVDAALGKFTVRITQGQLAELPVGDYDHSLIRMAGGLHLRVWSGMLTNNAGPSR
ncbi:hypothetical protein [Bradyrhizobium sp. 170]|uniref:hypothetical protein n=1 Tax=Bradyrhizobium sp. 170 TaxID=2782641 RepID=UPI001FFECA24|nr:hypothetical protein [Bradyrhizobium sp. 170]UPK03090.1 hypothetical protein IVB05_37030 [Bradyrhizobium sp. 170]